MKTCPYCSETLKSLSGHHFSCPEMGWRESDKGKSYRAKISAPRPNRPPQIWSKERREAHSEKMLKASVEHSSSYRGRYNRGFVRDVIYNGEILQGSWELEVAKWLDSQGLKWKRPSEGISYAWNGIRTYYPDFQLEDGTFIEVKGYETERDRAKWLAVPGLIVIKKDRMKILSTSVLADFR